MSGMLVEDSNTQNFCKSTDVILTYVGSRQTISFAFLYASLIDNILMSSSVKIAAHVKSS